jgi:hypothetical protein
MSASAFGRLLQLLIQHYTFLDKNQLQLLVARFSF